MHKELFVRRYLLTDERTNADRDHKRLSKTHKIDTYSKINLCNGHTSHISFSVITTHSFSPKHPTGRKNSLELCFMKFGTVKIKRSKTHT